MSCLHPNQETQTSLFALQRREVSNRQILQK
jgi:hypothetical protein